MVNFSESHGPNAAMRSKTKAYEMERSRSESLMEAIGSIDDDDAN